MCLPNSGADDLLPILSFVALKSGLPQLVSECAALEEFIHERWGPQAHPCPTLSMRPRSNPNSPCGTSAPRFCPAAPPVTGAGVASMQVPDWRGGLLPDIPAERPELRGAAAPAGPGQVVEDQPAKDWPGGTCAG